MEAHYARADENAIIVKTSKRPRSKISRRGESQTLASVCRTVFRTVSIGQGFGRMGSV
jgi:hypothetical protein